MSFLRKLLAGLGFGFLTLGFFGCDNDNNIEEGVNDVERDVEDLTD